MLVLPIQVVLPDKFCDFSHLMSQRCHDQLIIWFDINTNKNWVDRYSPIFWGSGYVTESVGKEPRHLIREKVSLTPL